MRKLNTEDAEKTIRISIIDRLIRRCNCVLVEHTIEYPRKVKSRKGIANMNTMLMKGNDISRTDNVRAVWQETKRPKQKKNVRVRQTKRSKQNTEFSQIIGIDGYKETTHRSKRLC